MIQLMMRHGANGIIGVSFSAIGIISLLVAGILWHDLSDDRRNYVHAQGSVVENERRCNKGCSYRPVVEFMADGEAARLTGVVGNSTPVFEIGETVTVLYPEGRAADGRIDHWTESAFGILFGLGFFLIFGGIGLPMLFLALRSHYGRGWVQQNGTVVNAQLAGVARDTRVRVNNRSPYRITAQWRNPRDGKLHHFVSDSLWQDPSQYLKDREHVMVKLDPDRPQRYWMDIRFLPEAAN